MDTGENENNSRASREQMRDRGSKQAALTLKACMVQPLAVTKKRTLLLVPATMRKPGNQGIGTCSTRQGMLYALDFGGHKRVIRILSNSLSLGLPG